MKEIFYVANIIDYGRAVLLYVALQYTDWRFCAYYIASYLLDCLDGPVARALNQTSKLGYYLDMIIDRMSSVACLYIAAQTVASSSFIPAAMHDLVIMFLYANIVLVEVASHAVVCYFAEVCEVHQKEMGGELFLVRCYLQSKVGLFLGCAGFELCSLSLIMDSGSPWYPELWKFTCLLTFPFMLFRAAANISRLVACLIYATKDKGKLR